jgi:hypothetical protein
MSTSPSAAATASGIVKIPRVLVVDAVVPLNTQLPSILTIPQDADFEWWFLAAFRTNAAMKVLITEAATQRAMIFAGSQQSSSTVFNGVFIDNLAGLVAGNGAFPIAVPYVMPASRSYQHAFTDSSGVQNTVQLVYHGFALLQVSGS